MSLNNNFYILPKSNVSKEIAQKIGNKLDELIQVVFEREIQKSEDLKFDKYFTKDWLRSLLIDRYFAVNRFLGDFDYFFVPDDSDQNETFQLSEYAREDFRIVPCPNCSYNLSQKVESGILHNAFRNPTKSLNINCSLGILCPKCGSITDVSEILDRKLFGNFVIAISEVMVDYTGTKEILLHLREVKGVEFIVEHYMYV
ncbi:MAG: hypothetical protein AAGI23_22065 [Bacteroidota bacterium]